MKKILTLLMSVVLLSGCSGSRANNTFTGDGFTIKYSEQVEVLSGDNTAFFSANVLESKSTISVMLLPDYTLIANSIDEIEQQILDSFPEMEESPEFKDTKVAGSSARELILADGTVVIQTVLVPKDDTLLIIQAASTDDKSIDIFKEMIRSIKFTD